MTAVSPPVFPGSRSLAGWWRQLAPFHPRALWAGHILLHRVEALAVLHLLSRPDPISLFLLRAFGLIERGSLEDLDQRLHLGLPLLHQLLRQLQSEKLVDRDEDGTWFLTVLGRQGLEQGGYMRISHERRPFYFVHNEESAKPPHFLNIRKPLAALPYLDVDGWPFEPSHLQSCVEQMPQWKRRFGFPLEVQQILDSGRAGEFSPFPAPAWQRVVLDRPEQLVAALILVSAGETTERLLGFAVRPPSPSSSQQPRGEGRMKAIPAPPGPPSGGESKAREGWALESSEPVFVVEADCQEIFPDLAVDPSLDAWRQAWRAWCQPRALPAPEVDGCHLERQAYRLRITATPRLVDRLRAARSDIFKGEAWLLAGTGRFRAAAQIELVEANRERLARAGSGNG